MLNQLTTTNRLSYTLKKTIQSLFAFTIASKEKIYVHTHREHEKTAEIFQNIIPKIEIAVPCLLFKKKPTLTSTCYTKQICRQCLHIRN